MKIKFPYARPEINIVKITSVDIIASSTDKKTEIDWEDDNVVGDGWI